MSENLKIDYLQHQTESIFGDKNKRIILGEFNDHKGQFVITPNHTVERFIAICEDDVDYYYVTYDGRKISFHSCVGELIWLKNKIEEDSYKRLLLSAELNHTDFLSDNQEVVKMGIMSRFSKHDKLLAPLCLGLN